MTATRGHLTAVPLPVGNLQDVPAMLERLAADLRAGEYEPQKELVIVGLDANLGVILWAFGGQGSLTMAAGVLHFGLAYIEQLRRDARVISGVEDA